MNKNPPKQISHLLFDYGQKWLPNGEHNTWGSVCNTCLKYFPNLKPFMIQILPTESGFYIFGNP